MLDQPLTSKMIAEKDGADRPSDLQQPGAAQCRLARDVAGAWRRSSTISSSDDAIRVIVVSGAGGRAFVSGADISEFKERRASEEAAAAYAKISEARARCACRRP